MTKTEIRKKIIKARNEIPQALRLAADKAITESLLVSAEFSEAQSILIYVDYNGEVKTSDIIEAALKRGKKVFVPKVSGREMDFFRINSFDDLEAGAYGIMEPKVADDSQKFAGGNQALMVMPGVAFDRKGNRLGYGGGFYDRYLEKHSELQTVAVAYEMQIVDSVPSEPTDILPNSIQTEKGRY